MTDNILFKTAIGVAVWLTPSLLRAEVVDNGGIRSIDTHHTISKVRTATISGKENIVATTYDGAVLCYDMEGNKLWENELSGYMNHDLHCEDVDGDGQDEVMAANADGSLYCIDNDGSLKWEFQPNNAPMYSVTSLVKSRRYYVVCGGYDLNHYYLDGKTGRMLKSIPSSGYSIEKPWGTDVPPKGLCTVNFLRRFKNENGKDMIALHGVQHSMSGAGSIYLFEPLAVEPYEIIKFKDGATFGSMSIDSISGPIQRLLFGASSMLDKAIIASAEIDKSESDKHYYMSKLAKGNIDSFGYRVVQVEPYIDGAKAKYFVLFGSRVVLTDVDNTTGVGEVLASKYSYNDMCKHPKENKIILASAQSGGSCIHVIDLDNSEWKNTYKNLQPIGKIASILDNSDKLKSQIEGFNKPSWETSERPTVYFMSDYSDGDKNIKDIHANYESPIFLNSPWTNNVQSPESWNRDAMPNEFFRNRRDTRKSYSWTQEQVLNWFKPNIASKYKGIAMWGGHGNDPYYYSLETDKKMIDLTQADQRTVLIYPEMEGQGSDYAWMMNDLMYPLAKHCQENGNAKLFIRSKNIFWQANIYEAHWGDLISGKYSDVFIPSMEETSDKTMEMSVSGRLGMWCSGATDQWGSRCARDNTSFDRLRQHSHQMLPNHFLRTMVYQISMGATYLDNFNVDQEYMSLLWKMIAKGLLYVPNRNEILSINPVHLAILHPDEEYLEDGTNVKWTTFYESDKDSPDMVFSRLNGTWPGAATTDWDFSRYAAGVKDRRLNFLPPYNEGLVLMTPPYDSAASRQALTDYLHPMYSSIMKTYYTDGRSYYSDSNKSQKYSAKTYYSTIKSEISKASQKLPITVDGEVAWVSAQSAPNHIRLTIIDGGYLNPSDKEVTINFNTVNPIKITNLASGEDLTSNGAKSIAVTVPCGLFLFLDITLDKVIEGIESTQGATVKVKGLRNQINISGAEGQSITLMNIKGQIINKIVALSDDVTMDSPSGVMLVKLQGETHKTIVQ